MSLHSAVQWPLVTLTKKKSSMGEVRPKPLGVGLGAKARREVGDGELGLSLEELCLKGV